MLSEDEMLKPLNRFYNPFDEKFITKKPLTNRQRLEQELRTYQIKIEYLVAELKIANEHYENTTEKLNQLKNGSH